MISRKFIGKVFVCLSLFFSAFQNASAQEKPEPLTLNDILAKLTFTSRINKTVAQINAKLVEQIEERKVGFELTKDDEQKITKHGGNLALIKAVKTNFLETHSPEEFNMELFLKLWDCNSKTDLASRKKCLSIANKLARYFEEAPSTARDYNELKSYAQKMDELIKTSGMKKNAAVENFPNPALPTIIEQAVLYNRFVACYAKTDLESRKSCVKIAKEFLTKYENDPEVKAQIEYFRAYIPQAEQQLKNLQEGMKQSSDSLKSMIQWFEKQIEEMSKDQ